MKGEFEVEPGFGSERDELLKDQKIKTFLILDKSQQTKDYESSNINESKSDGMVPVNEPTVILQQRRQSVVRWADKLPRLSLSKCMKDEYWKPEIPFSNVRKDHNFFLRMNFCIFFAPFYLILFPEGPVLKDLNLLGPLE